MDSIVQLAHTKLASKLEVTKSFSVQFGKPPSSQAISHRLYHQCGMEQDKIKDRKTSGEHVSMHDIASKLRASCTHVKHDSRVIFYNAHYKLESVKKSQILFSAK